MLDENNILVKAFRMVRESVSKDTHTQIKLRLPGKRGKDGRRYNLPTTDEVAALVVGGFDIDKTDRDIVVEIQKDGYKEDIPLNKRNQSEGKGRQEVSMREFFTFKIQERLADGSPLLYSRRLFQQFLVDGFSIIGSSRLNYIRLDQERIRCEMYRGIKEAVLSGETTSSSHGKRIILPSSFTRGPRYIIQNYQDAMAICNVVGYPDLFTIFTCNSKWPEVEDFLKNRKLNAEDRLNIVCRTFKTKLDLLIKDIKDDKLPTADNIDKIISAKIPDKELNPEYLEVVEKHMMHGPCGLARKDSSCMENGKYIRHFAKRFVDSTTVDDDGYPVYRRREDGRTISKSVIDLDNRYDRVTTSFYESATEDAELDEYDKMMTRNILMQYKKQAIGGSGTYLRKIFAMLLFSNSMNSPENVWQKTWHLLSDDILHRQKRLLDNPGLILMDDELKDLTLMEIENMNQLHSQLYGDGMNMLICDELCYDKRQLALDHATYMQQLTDEQTIVHKSIMEAAESGKGGVFFLFCIEALDRTMRDILRVKNPTSLDQPFGGKTVVFGSDFRQILPLLTLTKNMRLKLGDSNTRLSELKKFADWIPGIGDGSHGTPSDLCQKIAIPQDILVKDWDDPILAICKVTYPKRFASSNIDEDIEDRAILAPT
ncbi:uncharacterized protein [Arachis hypogaea]|uniref:uncharacterized protein n=1 Tax=Arachis hypogaea TaxID=3818 RepID=UPI003B20D8BC